MPGTEKFLTDSSGRFNLGVISMFVAGVSFLAGIEEREKLKKRELELEKKKWIYKAFCEYRAEWEFIFDSYQKVNSFLLKEVVTQRLEIEEIEKQQDRIVDEINEIAEKSKNESGEPDISEEQHALINSKLENVESAAKEKSTQKLGFISGFSDRPEAMSYYSSIDTHKLNKTYYELRLLVDTDEDKSELEASGRDSDMIQESMEFIDKTVDIDEDKSELEASGRDSDMIQESMEFINKTVDIDEDKSELEASGRDSVIIQKSMEFIDKTKDEMGKELYVYLFGGGLGIDRFRAFHEWCSKNRKTKNGIKKKLDEYAKKIAKETLK